MKKTNVAILILAHKSIDYFIELAKIHANIDFFIHLDSKVNKKIVSKYDNLIILDECVDVHWGDFTQIEAMLLLFKKAIKHSQAQFFHLISGEDVILCRDDMLERHLSWSGDEIFMELRESKKHEYRRFNTWHAGTVWQRKFLGKISTLALKLLNQCVKKSPFWFGSQWFSIGRENLLQLLEAIRPQDLDFFRKKLVPDEHFFQYVVVKIGLQHKISPSGHRRFISFNRYHQNGNSPIYLNLQNLMDITGQNQYFFARKCHLETQINFHRLINLIEDE